MVTMSLIFYPSIIEIVLIVDLTGADSAASANSHYNKKAELG